VTLSKVPGHVSSSAWHGLGDECPRLFRHTSREGRDLFEQFDGVGEDDRLDQSGLELLRAPLPDFFLCRSPCSP
jgi:hypothetical protein